MNTQTTLPISEARKKIFQIANEVEKRLNYYTLTEKGRPKAVIMSAEEFECWQETLEVEKEFPDLEKDIREVRREIETGEYKKYPTLEEVLAEEGFILSDKGRVKYNVRSNNKTKSKKSSKKNKR